MPFRFYLLVSGAYPDGRFVLGRKTNRFRSVGRCTYELNPRTSCGGGRVPHDEAIRLLRNLVKAAGGE